MPKKPMTVFGDSKKQIKSKADRLFKKQGYKTKSVTFIKKDVFGKKQYTLRLKKIKK